jgi:hypothetical protein
MPFIPQFEKFMEFRGQTISKSQGVWRSIVELHLQLYTLYSSDVLEILIRTVLAVPTSTLRIFLVNMNTYPLQLRPGTVFREKHRADGISTTNECHPQSDRVSSRSCLEEARLPNTA